jgi:tetratricopeptide (TPR) repeat protein
MSASFDLVSRRLGCTVLAFVVALAPHASLAAASSGPAQADDRAASAEVADADATDEPDDGRSLEEPHETADAGQPSAAQPSSEDADDDDGRAQALAAFGDATRNYELGRYEEAIAGFERAWELTEAPQLLYNIGQAYWRRFDVDSDIEHLRRAKTFFRNYDKRMQGAEFYDETEVKRTIEQIEAQIEEREAFEVERNRPIITGPSLAEQRAELQRQLALERQIRVTRALNGTGVTLIVLGAASLVMGIAGLTTRVTTGAVLETSSGGSGSVNLASAEQDTRRRRQYLMGGQVAFAGFVAGGIMLPVGITLRLVGRSRTRKGVGTAADQPEAASPAASPSRAAAVAVEPSGGLLTVHF